MVINNTNLIEDEAEGYKGAIQTEWVKFIQLERVVIIMA